MRRPLTLAALMIVGACQAVPPELTEEEIAQIEAQVLEAIERNFEGFRQLDLEMALEPMDTEISWSWSSVPLDYSQMREATANALAQFEAYEGEFTPVALRVLTPDAAVIQFTYECTLTYADGRMFYYPGNVTQTNLLERRPDGWKFTLGSQTLGSGIRIDQVFGTYDFDKLFSEDLPNDTYTGGTLEWRTDGSWTGTYFRVDGSDPGVQNGRGRLGPGPDGCVTFTAWQNESPEDTFSGTVCDGVLDDDAGTFHGRKRQ
jgi:hypothetical protein